MNINMHIKKEPYMVLQLNRNEKTILVRAVNVYNVNEMTKFLVDATNGFGLTDLLCYPEITSTQNILAAFAVVLLLIRLQNIHRRQPLP